MNKKRVILILLFISIVLGMTTFIRFDFNASQEREAKASLASLNSNYFTFTDDLNDFTQVYSRQNNMSLDTASAALYFEGDQSRITRSDITSGSFTYNRGKITDFSIKTYYKGSLGITHVYTSTDGHTWTIIPFTTDAPVATSGNWFRTNITPNAKIPYNTNYLKIQIVTTGNGQSWGTEIGQVNLTTAGMDLNFLDHMDDFSKVYSKSSNIALDTSSAAFYFEHDTSRAVKTDKKRANMVYKQNNLISFDIKTYYNGNKLGDLRLYTSSDGTTWTLQTYAMTVPIETGKGTFWFRTNLIPSGSLPSHTNYLKIEINSAGNGQPRSTQIAEVHLVTTNYTDDLNDLTKTYMPTTNIRLDTANAALYFEGDTSRATRSNNNPGSFVYYKHDISSFNVNTYYNGSLGKINIYTSRDGEKWVKQPYFIAKPVLTSSNWYRTYLSPNGKLPAETNYLKIEIVSSGNGEPSGTQIGQVNLAISYFIDELDNYFFMYAHSANISFESTSASAYFEGDQSRLIRTDNNTAFFTYNKNNMTDFAIKTYYYGSPGTVNLYISSDAVTWAPIVYSRTFTVPASDGWYRTYLKPSAALPASTNYLKVEIAASGNGQSSGTKQIGSVYIKAFNDPVAEINTILQQKGKVLKDVFGATHVGGTYHFTTKNFLNEGADQLRDLGTNVIKVDMDMPTYGGAVPSYQSRNYKWNSNWGVMSTLTQFAQHPYFVDLFNKPFKTYVITTIQPHTMDFGEQLSTEDMSAVMQEEYDQIYNLTVYLLKTYRNTGKTFILQNWETDWVIHDDWDLTKPNDTKISNVIAWMNKRQDAVNQARRDFPPQGVNVYNAIEANWVVGGMQGKVSTVNDIVPFTHTDLYSYSAYDTTYDEHEFKTALDYYKSKAPDSAAFGNNNVYIGEFGRPEINFGERDLFQNVIATIKVAIQNDVPYILYWQLYSNHGTVENTHNIYDDAGFWLIKPTGEKSILWHTLRQLMMEPNLR